MDHTTGVGIGDGLANLLEDAQEPRQVVLRVAPLMQERRQGAALDQLHGEVGPAVGEGPQLIDRDDSRMLELSADLRLLDEATE